MESFELRMQLNNLLLNLNSSKQASSEVCTFLVRNYVSQEDLYPAFLEVLPRLDINKRLNMFQFIDDFLALIKKEPKYRDNDIIFNYAFLIISDLRKILQYVIPQTPQLESDDENEQREGKLSYADIRPLSNLPFCYKILYHISKVYGMTELSDISAKYESNLLTEKDLEGIRNGEHFNESQTYNNEAEPTKTSHVDDYINSSPSSDIKKQSHGGSKPEESYIPEQINRSLHSAWDFLLLKRRQSQYESMLIDVLEDPFNLKSEKGKETESKQPPSCLILQSSQPEANPAPSSSSTHHVAHGNNTMVSSANQDSSKNVLALSHNLILQRIEADRERQKRGKETLWETERSDGKISITEFEYIYDTLQAFDEEKDKPLIEEMDKLYQLCTFDKMSKPKQHSRPDRARQLQFQSPSHAQSKSQVQSSATPHNIGNKSGHSDKRRRAFEETDLFYGSQTQRNTRKYPNNGHPPQNTYYEYAYKNSSRGKYRPRGKG
ncbi:hypothetical protein JL09_g579 [Pichia kudriavzevii]|uniref:CID domain-containing protein n=1 Tax=Pichia kudriavzevii TaxID=4909 RepID=A0A099P7B4_PICKU|nr:hypothetical protein JL09_g579 [Pichia kudriavzevii]